jgi:multidrug efflux pump subunit AcrA (membrane-fusion protein)
MHASKILSCLLLLNLSACFHADPPPPAAVEKIDSESIKLNSENGIKITEAQKKPFPVTIEFNGKISVPDKDIETLSSRVSGRLESLNVSIGDKVEKGSPVGTIWSSDLATAAEEYAIATREGGEILALTKKKLAALGVSANELSPGKTTFALRSSVTGVVLEKKVNSGAILNPGDAILTIGKMDSLQFSGDLPPENAALIKSGMRILFDDMPSLEATVSTVSPISDPSTHLVRIRAKFSGPLPKELPQESFMKARVVTREVSSLVVPLKSLLLIQGQNYIFVGDATNPKKFTRVAIVIESKTANEIAVSADKFKQTPIRVISEGALLANEALEDAGE